MAAVKTIGVLTSGGDAPGMNAAVRAVVRCGNQAGLKVLGIRRGYNGLINSDIVEMDQKSVNGFITRGGTELYTARCDEFKTEEGRKRAATTCKYLGIDGIIAIGGDGTFRGAGEFSQLGISTIGIPATIDNDIACTDYSIGFDTACNTAMEAVDKLRDTMQSHERCSLVEVMGRRAGHLALQVGISSGATAILVPERKIDFEKDIVEKIRDGRIKGKTHYIFIIAEGVGRADEFASKINEATGIDTRVTILGHVQRGGRPTARDRVAATRMGCYAVDLLLDGKTNRVVAFKGEELVDFDIEEALAMKKDLDEQTYCISKLVGR